MPPVPRVCIGIPVYNGERYLAATVEACLAQTHHDLEVVIADNASTDGTAEIARGFVERDPRVRYAHFSEHVGVADSFTRTFRECRSEYFKWAASDDLTDPTFVEKAVAVLDAQPDVVVCYSEAAVVDETGAIVRRDDFVLDLDDPRPSTRFRRLVMAPPKRHGAHEQYGVIRADAMRRTGVMSTHVCGDRVLLAQLTLLGRLVRLPEVLFFNRDHDGRSQRDGRPKARPGSIVTSWLPPGPWPPSEFWNPRLRGRIVFPEFDLTGQYVRTVLNGPIPAEEKARCLAALAGMAAYRLPKYGRDVAIGTEQAVRLARAGTPPWHGGLHEHFGDQPRAAAPSGSSGRG